MPAEIVVTGPVPPAGSKWCFVCAYTWKAAVNDHFVKEVEQAMAAPDGSDPVVLDAGAVEGLPALFCAVAVGLYMPLQQMGPLELCWTHLNAIKLQTASGLALPVPGMGGMPGQGLPGMNGFRP